MSVLNLTPHEINIVGADGVVIRTIPSSGLVRLATTTASAGMVDGIPLTQTVFGDPEGLPEMADGAYFIVSSIVKAALPNRADLLVPSEMVRDADGRIIGCRSLGL
jgi:hypothetical protein